MVVLEFFRTHPVLTALAVLTGGTAAVHFWSFRIRPLFIPRADVDATVDGLIAQHAQRAGEIAFIAEDRAWRYCRSYEQGKWRRVRRELWRRHVAGELE